MRPGWVHPRSSRWSDTPRYRRPVGESAIAIETPIGPARAVPSPAPDAIATVVLGHGAGGGIQAPDLVALARELPRRAISVVRVEQPWQVAGRKVSAPPAMLDRAWLAVLEELEIRTPLVVGGRSAGARVACRTALHTGARGVVALAFPLHPPGGLGRSGVGEVTGAGVRGRVGRGRRTCSAALASSRPGPSCDRCRTPTTASRSQRQAVSPSRPRWPRSEPTSPGG